MKKLFIILSLLLINNLSANELAWVDEQVEAIKPPRIGINERKLAKLSSPFIFLKKNREEETKAKAKGKKKSVIKSTRTTKVKKTKKFQLVLNAVLNKSALISGKWFQEGDKAYGFTLSKIYDNSVLLVKKNKKLLLSTKSKNLNLKFKNK